LKNIKLTIEYDGTNYHGWQQQVNAITVQETVKKAIDKLTGEDCKLTGASRTDEGVHAVGQVANFVTESNIPPDKFWLALNTVLPDDIVIKSSQEVDIDFHARFSAKGKRYRYLIHNSPCPSALMRNRAYFVPRELDIEAMKSAVMHFQGKHDFSAFRASGSDARTSERIITSASLDKKLDMLELEIAGNGFLYNMVRIIAGTLVYVGEGKICAQSIPGIIAGLDRRKAGKTAPPHGLYLMEVFY